MNRIISHNIKKDDGSTRSVIIEPVLALSTNDQLSFTGVYALYVDTHKKSSNLLDIQEIAPEIGESKPLLDDKNNPDFLGQLTFKDEDSEWQYTKGSLPVDELEQIVSFIKNSKN
jgi:hypothetical protein